MVTEDYVSFETAKLLAEKGIEDDCEYTGWIGESGNHYFPDDTYLDDDEMIAAQKDRKEFIPLISLQMAIKWLNDVHHILVVSDYEYEFTDTSWYFKIYKLVDEHGKCERWPINAVEYIDGLEVEVTVAFRDYMRSYKDYATREEAEEDGIRYVLENCI